mmetsp:Transcript_8525/g.18167  ORF Transcript_8525/g.18167 Transcript_8525/m.18167 type:complete len:645 (-) Transcript_8525:127-2061(-)
MITLKTPQSAVLLISVVVLWQVIRPLLWEERSDDATRAATADSKLLPLEGEPCEVAAPTPELEDARALSGGRGERRRAGEGAAPQCGAHPPRSSFLQLGSGTHQRPFEAGTPATSAMSSTSAMPAASSSQHGTRDVDSLIGWASVLTLPAVAFTQEDSSGGATPRAAQPTVAHFGGGSTAKEDLGTNAKIVATRAAASAARPAVENSGGGVAAKEDIGAETKSYPVSDLAMLGAAVEAYPLPEIKSANRGATASKASPCRPGMVSMMQGSICLPVDVQTPSKNLIIVLVAVVFVALMIGIMVLYSMGAAEQRSRRLGDDELKGPSARQRGGLQRRGEVVEGPSPSFGSAGNWPSPSPPDKVGPGSNGRSKGEGISSGSVANPYGPNGSTVQQSPLPSFRSSSASASHQASPRPAERGPETASAPRPGVDLPSKVQGPRHLCPGLVVPRGNECVVAVPVRPSAGFEPGGANSFNVRELSGAAVIQVEMSPTTWDAPRAEGHVIVLLRAAHGSKPLIAYCKTGPESGGRRSVYVYDSKDELFAHITKVMTLAQMRSQSQRSSPDLSSRPCYVLTSGRVGLQLLFDGNFREHAVNVTNEQRRMLADTEPSSMKFDPAGSYYRLRVIENVDVGLVLCALLSIDEMEAR